MLMFVMWMVFVYLKKRYIYKKTQSMPFPDSYKKILQNIVYYQHLPDELKVRIHKKMLFFMETKEFIGVHTGVSDEMKVVISFFACMMVVNMDDEFYDELESIIIYPYEMVMDDVRVNDGVYSHQRLVLEGQSIGGAIVIAWDDAKKEAYHLRHHNVLIHELAHVLDFEEGAANGVPILERSKYDSWCRVLYGRFSELRHRVEYSRNLGIYNLIGKYASTNGAEFFAVVSELFFGNPKSLKEHFPDLYDEFSIYYRLDPAEYM